MTPVNAGMHTRENLSVLARSEKRALIWIARRLPHFINSDHLSALGLVAMAAAGLSFAAFRLSPWAAVGVVVSLAANWFGDSLDGTVARVRNQQRPRYGFYVDHIIDVAGTRDAASAGWRAQGLMNPLVALTVLVLFLVVSAESYLATHAAGIFRMSFLGFGPTELRILMAVGAIKAAMSPWVALGSLAHVKLFDVGGSRRIDRSARGVCRSRPFGTRGRCISPNRFRREALNRGRHESPNRGVRQRGRRRISSADMVLAALSLIAHWPLVVATPLAVEAAVLTNFFWHERWTWRDRVQASSRWSRLLRFHVTNGITSLVGNTIVTVLLAAVFGLNPIAGNVVGSRTPERRSTTWPPIGGCSSREQRRHSRSW